MTSDYDRWLQPPEPEWGTCECSHSEEDHGEEFGICFICRCDRYTEYEQEQEREDAAIRRWEERTGR